ncbi:Small-conductance mechanosensitive channel [Thalassocella blandensis]|nr:Small-conductance mechanosensitive channel [Thalassocella blandensis]
MNPEVEEGLNKILQQAPEFAMTYGVKLIVAIAIFVIGKWIATLITKYLLKMMVSRNVDLTISKFTCNILYYAMVTVIVIAALGQIGVQTASFVAVVGAAGLAIGFALQGSLSNFAAGVMLILFKPFRAGDFVEAGGTSGTVHEITIFTTVLKTPDNKTVIVSNSDVLGNNITNYSTEANRRVDFTVGVSYDASIDAVKTELQAIAEEESRRLEDKDVTIAVAELADSSVNFVLRLWVKKEDYWGVFFDTNEKIKKRFDEKGIGIPYPQMDVHVVK